jgi:hypothetical protein
MHGRYSLKGATALSATATLITLLAMGACSETKKLKA